MNDKATGPTVMLPNNKAGVQEILNKLTQNFLRGSIKFSLNFDEIETLTPDVQKTFLRTTIHLTRFKEYPLNSDFCRIFFKKLIGYLGRDQEILDEMYIFLCSQMEKPNDIDEFCYRHYVIKDNINNIITIKETKNMAVHGTTGMRTWEAALMLSDWAMCNEKLIENKKLLELGSGIGFTGIAIVKNCNIQSIILSDWHEEVLSTIQDNVRINLPNFQEKETRNVMKFCSQQKFLGIMMLNWCHRNNIPNEILPDIIIGADLLYDPLTFRPLCKVLLTFFRRNNDLEVYIASVIRNYDTFQKFLDTLGKYGLKHQEIFQLQPVCVRWDHQIKRKFLKIKYI